MHTTQESITEFLRQTMFSIVVAVRINLWVSYCVFISDCRSQCEKHNDLKFWHYFGTFNKQMEFTYTSGIIVLKEDINPINLLRLPSLPLATIAGDLYAVCMSNLGTLTIMAISHLVFHWLMSSMTSTSLPFAFQCHHRMMPPHSLILHGSSTARFHWLVFISLETVVIFPKEWSLTTEETLPGHEQAAGWTEGS